ncbi:MAG: GIY-YIG nuclease family protein [Pyrinomonadaceae bacterium]
MPYAEWYPFDEINVRNVPDGGGIYQIRSKNLYREKNVGSIIYIGRSFEGGNIKGRLQKHLRGQDGNQKLTEWPREDLEFSYVVSGREASKLISPYAEVFQISALTPACNDVANKPLVAEIENFIDGVQRGLFG